MKEHYQTYQRMLSDYCRTGTGALPPGITSSERVEVYRNLTFRGIESALSRAYPITKKFLGPSEWRSLVEELFSNHDLPSPELWRMPKELWNFIRGGHRLLETYPFFENLLRFEWEEIEIYMAGDPERLEVRPPSDWREEEMVLNPVHVVLELEYPVFDCTVDELREPNKISERRGCYYLLLFREPKRDTVRFIELNPFYAEVLSKLGEAPRSLRSILQEMSCEDALQSVARVFQQLYGEGGVLGVEGFVE